MLRRAIECVVWQGMAAELKQIAFNCEACQTLACSFGAAKTNCWQSARPMAGGKFTVWTPLTTGVIRVMKAHFARLGIPSTLVSDNGPQFISEVCVWMEYPTAHQRVWHPNTNGKAESVVKTAKQMIEKGKRSHTDPFVICYHLMSWRIQTGWGKFLPSSCLVFLDCDERPIDIFQFAFVSACFGDFVEDFIRFIPSCCFVWEWQVQCRSDCTI